MNSRWISVIALALGACARAETTASTGATSAGGSQAGIAAPDASAARSDAAVVDAAPAAPARLTGVPATIAAGEAVIIAPSTGATVTMQREGAAAIELHDGERVRVIQENVGLDAREQTVEVEARSMRGLVANTAVLTEERVRRSRDGR